MDLAEPALTDLDVGAYVQVWSGDRAPASRMPVVGEQLAASLLLTQVKRDTKPLEAALDAMIELIARLSGGS